MSYYYDYHAFLNKYRDYHSGYTHHLRHNLNKYPRLCDMPTDLYDEHMSHYPLLDHYTDDDGVTHTLTPDASKAMRDVINDLVYNRYYKYRINKRCHCPDNQGEDGKEIVYCACIDDWWRELETAIYTATVQQQTVIQQFLVNQAENQWFWNDSHVRETRDTKGTGNINASSNSESDKTGQGSSTSSSNSTNESTATAKNNAYSQDTPQNRITDLSDHTYLTSANEGGSTSENKATGTGHQTDTQTGTQHSADKASSETKNSNETTSMYAKDEHDSTNNDITQQFKNFIQLPNIYEIIIEELKPCFLTSTFGLEHEEF